MEVLSYPWSQMSIDTLGRRFGVFLDDNAVEERRKMTILSDLSENKRNSMSRSRNDCVSKIKVYIFLFYFFVADVSEMTPTFPVPTFLMIVNWSSDHMTNHF